MNTQSPPTTLSEERLKEIQVLRDARLYPDNWNEAHNIAEATRYSLADCEYAFALHNAFPSLLHAAEQMAKQQEENKRLKDAFNKIWELGEMGYLTTDYLPDVECGECGAKAKSRDAIIHEDHYIQGVIAVALLPSAPEKGGAA